MITEEMRRLIEENTLGFVATVAADGSPKVSPKATTVVLDGTHVAFGDLRSPGTVRNILERPAVELNYVDVFRRKACRLTGRARYHKRGAPEFDALLPRYAKWGTLQERLRGIVVVDVAKAEMIVSPAYDGGATEAKLKQEWLAYYTRLVGTAANEA